MSDCEETICPVYSCIGGADGEAILASGDN